MGGLEGLLRRALMMTALAASMAGATACVATADAGAAPLLWAVDTAAGTVSTLETPGGQETGQPIKTGEGPNSIAITPNGRRAYVANFLGDSVTVIETGTRTPIKTIPLTAGAESIAISPDGKTAYVTVAGTERVFTINTESNSVTGSFVGGGEVLAVSPSGEIAFVGVAPEDVQMISLPSGTPMGSPIKLGASARGIAISPNGKAVYVAAGTEVDVIEGGAVAKEIPLGSAAAGLAVSPDGTRVYGISDAAQTVTTINTGTDKVIGTPIFVGGIPHEIALTPNGLTAFVATGTAIVPVDLTTGVAGTPIARTDGGAARLVVAPDQPPVAAFNPPEAFVGIPTTFSAAPSTDSGGSIANYQWRTNFAGSPTGLSFTHTFTGIDNYFAMLTVTDQEGCGPTQIFTGRTAYCNGGPIATVTHPITVQAAPILCGARFAILGISHNRKNGTVRLRVKFPATGWFLLFGKKVHAVTRKVRKPGTTTLTLHPRIELAKRLKKTLRAQVRFRLTFTPSAGCGSPSTLHRSVALLRAPRPKHRR